MSLKSEIETLRDTTASGLSAAHDHFVYTKKLWRIIDIEIRRRGRKIILDNKVTGSRLTERDLLPVAQASVNDYLPSATIQQMVSLTETFLTDLVRLWVTAYPFHLKGQSVEIQTIVAAPDKASILAPLIENYVLAMGYKRPTEWFRQLQSMVSIPHPTQTEAEQFAEFKATRDVFVHNRGVATAIYADKAGANARAAAGLPLDLPDAYLHAGWALCRKIVLGVASAVAAKA